MDAKFKVATSEEKADLNETAGEIRYRAMSALLRTSKQSRDPTVRRAVIHV